MFRFPKAARLLQRSEFRNTLDNGIKVTDHNLVFVARPVSKGKVRIGLIVSKKVGGAVVRNRIKRAMRERFRTTQTKLRDLELVVIARQHAAVSETDELFASYDRCMARLERRIPARAEASPDAESSNVGLH
jgi:ribonuclease P protein component